MNFNKLLKTIFNNFFILNITAGDERPNRKYYKHIECEDFSPPRQGVYLRRYCKQLLAAHPPERGEMVFALDTGEHGWLDQNGKLVWRLLSEDKTTEIEKECICKTIHIFKEFKRTNIYDIKFFNTFYNIGINYNISIKLYLNLVYVVNDIRTDIIYDITGKVHLPNDISENQRIETGANLEGTMTKYVENLFEETTVLTYENISLPVRLYLNNNGIIDISVHDDLFMKGKIIGSADIVLQETNREISKYTYGTIL